MQFLQQKILPQRERPKHWYGQTHSPQPILTHQNYSVVAPVHILGSVSISGTEGGHMGFSKHLWTFLEYCTERWTTNRREWLRRLSVEDIRGSPHHGASIQTHLWYGCLSGLFYSGGSRASNLQGTSSWPMRFFCFPVSENIPWSCNRQCILIMLGNSEGKSDKLIKTIQGLLTDCKYKSKAFILTNPEAKVSTLRAKGSSRLGFFLSMGDIALNWSVILKSWRRAACRHSRNMTSVIVVILTHSTATGFCLCVCENVCACLNVITHATVSDVQRHFEWWRTTNKLKLTQLQIYWQKKRSKTQGLILNNSYLFWKIKCGEAETFNTSQK